MSKYELTVVVTYTYEVEADSYEEAHEQGFDYEDYQHNGEIERIKVYELDDDEEEEDE